MSDLSMRVCKKCGQNKPSAEFWVSDKARGYLRSSCKECDKATARTWYHRTPENKAKANANSRKQASLHPKTPEQYRKHTLKYKFGLTPERVAQMLKEQADGCALCGTDNHGRNGQSGRHDGSRRWQPTSWSVDHDHQTNVVRGLLCHQCNVQLGAYENLMRKVGWPAIREYLKRGAPEC